MSRRVLLVEDDADVRDALGQTLDLAGLEAESVASVTVAKDRLVPDYDGVVLCDIRMPGRDGFHFLHHVQRIDPELPVILLTGEGDVPMAVRAMAEGAFDFLEKPCAPQDLLGVLDKALRTRGGVLDARRQKRRATAGDAAERWIFGVSARAAALRDRVRQVARTDAEVLITGAPGSGLSKVAEVIHLLSGAASRPFHKVRAASLGAGDVAAAVEAAGQGTLYLYEVARLTTAAQFALRARIEAGAGMRVIAGTTDDPDAACREGRFDPDLLLRLDVLRVRIPSLSERPEDIPAMFRAYVAQAADQAGVAPPEVDDAHLARLTAQDWPGNTRALMNAAMRFALGAGGAPDTGLGLAERMAAYERSLLVDALKRFDGRASDAARSLQLPRKTFYDKLARHHLRPESYRS